MYNYFWVSNDLIAKLYILDINITLEVNAHLEVVIGKKLNFKQAFIIQF